MEIKQDPYETLYQVSRPVKDEEMCEVKTLAKKALKLLRSTKNGVGLAANQVGDTRRWFVSQAFKVVINPSIIARSEEATVDEEGCLSKVGHTYMVERPEEIRVSWTSEKGTTIQRRLTGFKARLFQHEVDHLDGKNIWQEV